MDTVSILGPEKAPPGPTDHGWAGPPSSLLHTGGGGADACRKVNTGLNQEEKFIVQVQLSCGRGACRAKKHSIAWMANGLLGDWRPV